MSAVQHDNIPLGSAEDLHVTPRRDGLISQSRVTDTVTALPSLSLPSRRHCR
jgi:hypothetical protein